MKTRIIIALLSMVLLVGTQVLIGQPNYYLTIYATDQVQSDSIKIGLHQLCTYGVNGKIAFGLGDTLEETLWPPVPTVGPLDVRVLDHLSSRGTDLVIDIRNSSGNGVQTDTFVVSFRSSDEVGSDKMTFSWKEGLGNVGYGGFKLVPYNLPPPLNASIDMTKQTSYTYPVKNSTASQTVYIIIGDGYKMRSFEAESLALASDYSGKPKAEKRKNYASKWTVTFTNTTGQNVAGLKVKFSQNVTAWLSSVTLFTPLTLPSKGEFHINTGNIPPGGSYVVSGLGDKGKPIAAKGAKWTNGASGIVIGEKFDGSAESQLLLRMPNINNVGEEVYAQPGNVDAVNGIVLGVYGATNKCVIHPKWKDVTKTMNSKGTTHKGGTAACFDTYKGSPFKAKPMKGYEPKAQKNELVAELMTLKFNIAASKAGKIPTGFGSLVYRESGSPFDGQTVDTIAAKADQFLTYCLTEIKGIPYTAGELKTLLGKINGSFSGVFDTLTFGGPSGSKPSGTSLGGVKPVLMVDYLYRTSGYVPPANNAKYEIEQAPVRYELMQNYPNPFNPTTNIQFNLEEDAVVTVKVYNMLGQEVRTLVDREEFTEGPNDIEFDASGLASGVYYYRLIVNDGQYNSVKKMMLIK